jgi:hypothetical protein
MLPAFFNTLVTITRAVTQESRTGEQFKQTSEVTFAGKTPKRAYK